METEVKKDRLTMMREFYEMPDYALVNTEHVAAFFGVTPGKLNADRTANVGVPYAKIGRTVRYRKSDVLEYVNDRIVEPDDV